MLPVNISAYSIPSSLSAYTFIEKLTQKETLQEPDHAKERLKYHPTPILFPKLLHVGQQKSVIHLKNTMK